MGASGHVLGSKKLAWLSRKVDLPLSHALRGYSGSDHYEAMVRQDGECQHYRIDAKTFEVEPLESQHRFSSCQDYLNPDRYN